MPDSFPESYPETFKLVEQGGRIGITCLQCHLTSYNPNDVERHYCGRCRLFHDDIWPPARAWVISLGQARLAAERVNLPMTEQEALRELEDIWLPLTEAERPDFEAELRLRAAVLGWTGDPLLQPPTSVLAAIKAVRRAPGRT